MKGLYTPHSWKLIELFTANSVLRVRKCTGRSKSLTKPPLLLFFSSWPWLEDDLKPLQSTLPYVV